MLEQIVSLLKESGVHAWELSDVQTRGWEFYFIRHALDQNRAKNVEHIQIKVYQLIEDGKFMGSASAELPPTATGGGEEAHLRPGLSGHPGEKPALSPEPAPGGGAHDRVTATPQPSRRTLSAPCAPSPRPRTRT